MSQDLLAEAETVKKLLADLKNELEANTVDVTAYAARIKSEFSPLIVNIVTNAANSAEIINQYSILLVLVLDPITVAFYLQPVVQQWLDLIMNAIKEKSNSST